MWQSVKKKACLASQVSVIIQYDLLPKYKDPGTLTISYFIRDKKINNSLLNLRSSVNLLPYTVYQHLGLGALKPTRMNLQLAYRSLKFPKGIVKDILVQIDSFIFLVDFVILDIEPVQISSSQIHVIFGQPFLATTDVTIRVRSGIMTLVCCSATQGCTWLDDC